MNNINNSSSLAELSPEEIMEKVKGETPQWKQYANILIGVLAFSLAIGCLGTPHPKPYALASLVFILLLIYTTAPAPSSTLRRLSEKKDKTESDTLLIKRIEKEALSAHKNLIPFTLGMMALVAVIILGD